MEVFLSCIGEIFMAIVYVLCKVFGREPTEIKIAMRRKKQYRRQEKKVKKEANKLEDDLQILKELE